MTEEELTGLKRRSSDEDDLGTSNVKKSKILDDSETDTGPFHSKHGVKSPLGNRKIKKPRVPQQTNRKNNTSAKTKYRLSVIVRDDKVGLIIGKGGVTVKAIESKHRCKVDIPKAADPTNASERTLTVIAENMEEADRAKNEIISVCNGTKLLFPVEPQIIINTFCTVPNDKVGCVIGTEKRNLKRLEHQYGVKIHVPVQPDLNSMPPTRTLSITGLNQNIPKCIEEITKLIYRRQHGDVTVERISHQAQPQYLQVPQSQPIFQQQQPIMMLVQPPVQTEQNNVYKYTRIQWQQWKIYYQSQGLHLDDEAPIQYRADNYF